MIAHELVRTQQCSVQAARQAVGVGHCADYYQPQGPESERLPADLAQAAGQHPTNGSGRLSHQLWRAPYGYRFKRKRIQRLMRRQARLRPVKRVACHTTNSRHA